MIQSFNDLKVLLILNTLSITNKASDHVKVAEDEDSVCTIFVAHFIASVNDTMKVYISYSKEDTVLQISCYYQ